MELWKFQADKGAASFHATPPAGLTGRSVDLNRTDFRVVHHGGELDRDLPSGDEHAEGPVDGSLARSGLGHDIEVAQDRLTIDDHVENALAGRGPVDLGKFECD